MTRHHQCSCSNSLEHDAGNIIGYVAFFGLIAAGIVYLIIKLMGPIMQTIGALGLFSLVIIIPLAIGQMAHNREKHKIENNNENQNT